ncbi:hypothetical protein ACLOJK_016800 [Asimina triloba]
MAFGKNTRVVDNRRSSSLSSCSTVTIVVFVALCLVGIWMMSSSSIVTTESVELSSKDTKSEMKKQVAEGDARQFEDSSGDVPDDAVRGHGNNDAQDGTISEEKRSQTEDNNNEENQEENSARDSEEPKNSFDDTTKNASGNDSDGTTDSGETTEEGEVSSKGEKAAVESGETNENQNQGDEPGGEKKSESMEKSGETTEEGKTPGQMENVDQNQGDSSEQSSGENKNNEQEKDQNANEVFPDASQSELLNETNTQNGAWSTQAAESKNEKEVQKSSNGQGGYKWKLCNVTAGADYIPCLDNVAAIKKLHSTAHYEHRERHCPEEGPTCLVPLPQGYRRPIEWPNSRDKIWFFNVPHTKLAVVKGHQNWVKVTGDLLTFPGGGTQFKNGALHYIDFIQEAVPDIAWGKRSRVVLDVGCGVASFGGYLFDRDVLTMSFAPKDEHEAQVQFALERGVPAISAVMGSKRLPFPGQNFVQSSVRCPHFHHDVELAGGKLLLELNRMLRPGGYFVWSATPVYRTDKENSGIWDGKDELNEVGAAIYKKPSTNECYEKRTENNPPLCKEKDDPNAAWYVPLEACMHRVLVGDGERGSHWPEQWPKRLEKLPYWLNNSQVGVYGKAAPEDFQADYKHWKHVVSKSYLNGMGINWSTVRNAMDMNSVYGGFAAALRDMKVWVMNVVPIDSPDTLPIIYERGLFGIYHDWCESFSTYPRTYDLLHADHLFSKLAKRCNLLAVMAEVDRILRPEGKLIVRDSVDMITGLENIARSLQWEVRLTYSKDKEGLLCVQKSMWRPKEPETSASSSA